MPETVVVAGTASVNGRAIVNKFAAEGWNVVAVVDKECDLETYAGLPNVKTVLLDIDDEAAAAHLAQLARGRLGGVDVSDTNPRSSWSRHEGERWAAPLCPFAVEEARDQDGEQLL
jgi:NAD(P)-dependent dehydrogenase (short-subunit alcohol dehydrogenase family)